jgi:hypothetical protein
MSFARSFSSASLSAGTIFPRIASSEGFSWFFDCDFGRARKKSSLPVIGPL